MEEAKVEEEIKTEPNSSVVSGLTIYTPGATLPPPNPSGPLSSSDGEGEEEVEVQVRLEIHSPPADAQVELVFQDQAVEEEKSETYESVPDSTKSTPSPVPTSPPTTTRRWAPPKGFWRVARPETLLLNGVDPHNIPSALPCKDYTQTELLTDPQAESKTAVGNAAEDSKASSEFRYPCRVERYDGLCASDSASLQGQGLTAEEKLKVRQRAHAKFKERQQNDREGQEECGGQSCGEAAGATTNVDYEEAHEGLEESVILQELEPHLRSLLVISDELPLSPRHEQAKRLLERARLKARSNHVRGDRPCRRSHSDHRSTVKKQQLESHNPASVQKFIQDNQDLPGQSASGPLLVPDQRDTSPGDEAGRSRRYGCSPTRVRFEDESEKEAESRYLDRVRQRGRPAMPKSKNRDSNTDSSSSGSERSRRHRSVSILPLQKQDMGVSVDTTTVIKEIIVLVKKCESCGSVVREPQPVSSLSDPQMIESLQTGNLKDTRGKMVPCWVPPTKPEASTRPKAPLTVTFAGAYVLGESKESSTSWKSSGFGKLRRRSRKGESRLESGGHGPYGPSWAQRRNSNPRNRVNLSSPVSFAPDSSVSLQPRFLGTSSGLRETPTLPIKSALKSSSRNRSAASQSSVQFLMTSNQGGEAGPQHSALLDSPETRRDLPASLTQGALATSAPAPCIRPSTLRYSTAQPGADVWDDMLDGAVSADTGPASEFHPAMRNLALSRAEDLRAELLRAEHLKAEALWEETSDGSRKMDGRPKLFLRRFFSSIGLNSVGRLVKGGRSSSMEHLSIPTARPNTASPSPTRRPQPTIRIQRTPSLQSLHTALPLAQLRKASSVQSLERRTERTTILGEMQIPYGLAPSPDSPQLEVHRAMSVEDILASRMLRPAGRVSQAFPDGSLLLELIRPPNGPFGFVISRGKGRPDTGVYVEKVGDGTGEVPYVGLLGVGDEILQVNGEVVAGLSLDQVTRLMTRESVASLRIMPARRSSR
ncbi:uncharacterized protein LOC129176712 isoform X2 [Dunckerocampus dactyliophorus]|uniref:uncharacterized protein LOC129176712 isoform X2 n=1 Tax=Dunckerocampus dactyliophorus TaxID=161453 RepID=UPI00240565F9|nr:uncharacterized protein LOC129176712 isoform X2 [Dunckerocampus dactyliophorus]